MRQVFLYLKHDINIKNNTMRLAIALLLILVTACTSNISNQYKADRNLTESEKQEFVYEIIRYAGKLVAKASHETKFEQVFDMDYWSLAREHSLEYYYHDASTGEIYFSMNRIAPSIHIRKVGIGGIIKKDENNNIIYYEEIYRTWKMPEDELEKKNEVLFSLMVSSGDLSPYFPENSGEEEYIEFPNQHTYFDTENRLWVSTLEDPVGDLKRLQAIRGNNSETGSL